MINVRKVNVNIGLQLFFFHSPSHYKAVFIHVFFGRPLVVCILGCVLTWRQEILNYGLILFCNLNRLYVLSCLIYRNIMAMTLY